MGTPFKGTWLTYLAIFTPLGFFWKDVWQMRPGCTFLKELHASPAPPNLKIHCLYSREDKIAIDKDGVFNYPGEVYAIPMHHLSHFQFLARRDVAATVVKILRNEPFAAITAAAERRTSKSSGEVPGEEENESHKTAI